MQIHWPSLSSVLSPLGAITQYVGCKPLSCCIVTAIFQNATVLLPQQLLIFFGKIIVPCVPRGNLHRFPKTLFFWPKPVADPCPSDCATTRSHQVSTLTCLTVQPTPWPWQLLERTENELEEVVKKSHWPCWITDCNNWEMSLSPSNQTFLAREHE